MTLALPVSPGFLWIWCSSGTGHGDTSLSLWPSCQGWALCTLLLLGMRVTLGSASSTGQGEATSAVPAQGQTWLLQRSLHSQTSLREELNFSFFQSFFRGHKYLWRACQSSLGFLTECVTREGLLWWFIVNCSKLLSCQGAQRSYTMPEDAGEVSRMAGMLWGELLPAQGTLWSLGTSQVSLKSSNCSEAWLGETPSSWAKNTANIPALAGQSLSWISAQLNIPCTQNCSAHQQQGLFQSSGTTHSSNLLWLHPTGNTHRFSHQ